jgi:hypothetical protein
MRSSLPFCRLATLDRPWTIAPLWILCQEHRERDAYPHIECTPFADHEEDGRDGGPRVSGELRYDPRLDSTRHHDAGTQRLPSTLVERVFDLERISLP